MSAGRTLNVVVTGGSGPSGVAAARALRNAGHTVFTVGSDGPRIEAAAAEAGSGVTPLVCDLADLAAVRSLHATVHAMLAGTGGAVDGVIHLVGGWRGAKGITDQSDEDWEFLERGAITTVRNVTRVFYRRPRGLRRRALRHGLLHCREHADGGRRQLRGRQGRRRSLDPGGRRRIPESAVGTQAGARQ